MSLSSVKVPLFFALLISGNVFGADVDTIGSTLLHQVDPTLQGAGIRVAQPEASDGVAGAWEVNPAASAVSQPNSLFTWISSGGTSNTFPNGLGTESGHANFVAGNFYGLDHGVAQQVSHVDNYEAGFFYDNYIQNQLSISARVVNQSFIFSNPDLSHYTLTDEQALDTQYDNYATQYGVLFVSGAGNGDRIFPAATCYNGIGVAVYGGPSSFGPTGDGRCKPDITSPGGINLTSFSTPFVSGSAAVLMQAAIRGDGGANTNAANDNRTIKALLLNGAVKPANWTNSVISPLDARYGAGILNVFNSWNQLRGGKRAFIESTSVTSGNPHPPGANAGNEPVTTGWDLNSLTNADSSHDRINHYYFNLPGSNSFTLAATLNWLRPHGSSSINDLNLFLYNTANNNLVLCSTSAVDNVEHLFTSSLPPGRYDLQVQKNPHGQISSNETYALAFEFFNVSLNIVQSNSTAIISWPLAPAGFQLESTPNINPPVTWSPVTAAVSVVTNTFQNVVIVPITGANQFFRLQRP